MDRDTIRQRLLERKAEIEETVEAARATGQFDEMRDDTTGEFDPDDAADVGSETFEREQTFSIMVSAEERVREVEAALERLEKGSYGRCEMCNTEIPPARLEAKPEARFCVEHQDEISRVG
ncbi:MAG TPA: TraR/DksA C4-type zinc finger protein [Actinomycetota bacterium]|nr:TraR/DksA C4-type zinc finger protein [Actinomycetota bacterium]